MSNPRNYYFKVIIGALHQAGIKPEDKISSALHKMDMIKGFLDLKDYKKIKLFLKNHWDVERKYLLGAYETSLLPPAQKGYFPDPALQNSPIVRAPNGLQYVKVEDILYSKCPRCSGRLYPQFDFCPYCGFDLNQLPYDNELDPIVLPEVPGPMRIMRRPKFRRRERGTPFIGSKKVEVDAAKKVVLEDDDVGRITEGDLDVVEKNLHKYL